MAGWDGEEPVPPSTPPAAPPGAGAAPRPKPDAEHERAVREDFHGKTFSNATHRSATDPDARLYKKGRGQEAHLRYRIHNVTDVRSGVILSTEASRASGTAERDVSLRQLARLKYRFNNGRKWHPDRMRESVIRLPATSPGEPDWAYMGNYISTLPFVKRFLC